MATKTLYNIASSRTWNDHAEVTRLRPSTYVPMLTLQVIRIPETVAFLNLLLVSTKDSVDIDWPIYVNHTYAIISARTCYVMNTNSRHAYTCI